ncbi:MAG TPA: carboxypeptidase regulatory-like domain-containing protein [Alphaproteobacteria bacterium]|nr:carboxypeptidase regulatory-like domain-containing protein [Alphaproteobacteria bacterium]
MSKRFVVFHWLLPLLLIVAVAASAQTTASIQGTVTDTSGAAVAGAKVNVKNQAQGTARATETNSLGGFEVPALPPGMYTVDVSMKGFQSQLAKDVVLQVSQNTVQNFSLKVATTTETVTVEASGPVIETTTVTVGQVINQRTVQEIPLNGRHFVDLALLIPGTVTPPQNGFLTAPLRGQGSFAFNTAGNREDAVNFMINGINLNDMVQNQVTFQPTINTVSEFKVDNSTYSAEYGRNSGAIVNIATRSGTNALHGELYDYLRNNFFDARNAFNPIGQTQSPFKRNQFGGDLGGPIIKDKTFFFASYEGLRHRQGLTTTATVLNATDRATIQSGSNAAAKGLLQFIPVANGGTNANPQFFGSGTAPVDIDQGTTDISHNFSENDRLHGYYVYQRDLRQEPTQGANIPAFGDTREGHRQVLTLNETHVFSSNLVNEARLGANRVHITFSPNNLTDPGSVGLAGVLGANLQIIPRINIASTGLLFGGERNFPQGRGDTTFALADTVSYLRARHSFKFGAEFRDFRNNNFNNDPGQLTFNTVANFISGTVDSSARTLGNVANRINQNALDFFAQDSFKIKPYLTLELGLRYAWNMTPSEALDRFVNFVPVANAAGTGSTLAISSAPYAQNNTNFQPRLGFAWDLFRNGKTLLRGAYAYQVDQPITGYVTGLTSNPPFALPISVGAPHTLATLGSFFNPNNAANVAPSFVNPNFQNADIQSWNLNIQQQVTQNMSMMIGYFGTKGTHLEIDRNVNQPSVLGSFVAGSKPFVAFSATDPFLAGKTLANSITERDSNSNSSYHALWITANQRLSHGLQFNASYTWSHSIDEASRNNEGIVVQDSNNIASSRGSSDFDARHRFVANAIYDLPFKGNRLVSGWELAPIVSLQSGNPFNVVLATTTVNGVGNTVRPNVIGPIVISDNPLAQWIVNPGATFATPAPGTFGNLGRNAIVGPTFKNLDLALIKNTKVTERLTAQFRVDTFNLFNHPNYGQPGPVAANGSTILSLSPASALAGFSTIQSTRFPNGDSGSARQLQMVLRLMF